MQPLPVSEYGFNKILRLFQAQLSWSQNSPCSLHHDRERGAIFLAVFFSIVCVQSLINFGIRYLNSFLNLLLIILCFFVLVCLCKTLPKLKVSNSDASTKKRYGGQGKDYNKSPFIVKLHVNLKIGRWNSNSEIEYGILESYYTRSQMRIG